MKTISTQSERSVLSGKTILYGTAPCRKKEKDMNKKLYGILAVMVTPFNEKGEIVYEDAARHIEWLLASGVHCLLPLGATGEFSALTTEERKQFAEFVVKQAADRVPVCVGCVSQSVAQTVELARHAASIGADAVMCLPCPGLHLSQEEIYGYYKYLSENVNISVMVYNNPGSSGVTISPETLARIAELPHMDYLKESTGDIKRLTRAVDEVGDKLDAFCGAEDLAMESFIMGAKGWVCVLANIAPSMSVKLYEHTIAGQLDKARDIYRKVLPVLRLFEESGQLWQIAKYVLQKRGMNSGICRMPRQPISADVQAAVDAVLAGTELK